MCCQGSFQQSDFLFTVQVVETIYNLVRAKNANDIYTQLAAPEGI